MGRGRLPRLRVSVETIELEVGDKTCAGMYRSSAGFPSAAADVAAIAKLRINQPAALKPRRGTPPMCVVVIMGTPFPGRPIRVAVRLRKVGPGSRWACTVKSSKAA